MYRKGSENYISTFFNFYNLENFIAWRKKIVCRYDFKVACAASVLDMENVKKYLIS